MTKGISIHIGLNYVDPARYNGWDGELAGCINDARDLKAVADRLGYASSIMTDSQATVANVVRSIGQASRQLERGDMLLLTYSGHGSHVPDVNSDEPDGRDETWVLWDRMLLDDELYNLWGQFSAGVRIFMLSDSCHSGTVAKMMMYQQMALTDVVARQYRRSRSQPPKFRLAPNEVASAVYQRDADIYSTAQWTTSGARSTIGASVILISGCQDNQLSADGERNGLFTETLLQVWNNGGFSGNYARFHRQIADRMPATQSPNLFKVGATDSAFEAEKPFVLSTGASTGTGTSAAMPTITAPASVANGSAPARLTVNPGAGRYFAVEIATNPYYFNHAQYGSQRNDDNFFASWKTTPFGFAASYPAEYAIPQAAWNRLRRAGGRLYYRIWATDSPTAWVNAKTNTPDAQAQNAYSFALEAGTTATAANIPAIDGPSSIAFGSTPPRFLINPGPNRYAAIEVTTNPYYFIYSQYGAQRNDDNFFASWKSPPFSFSANYPMSYDLPQSAWNRLRANATRLYYRIWATDSPNSWVNAVANTPDANALTAKSIAIAREAAMPETEFSVSTRNMIMLDENAKGADYLH
jgi:hypothetical protein